MQIFIIRDGSQTGPFSEEAVKAFLTEGSVRPTDLGWRKGFQKWTPLVEVLNSKSAGDGDTADSPPTTGLSATSLAAIEAPATAKQKAFLKYLGAEFGENLTKERAALAVSDAIETPRLQIRIRKWHDEKMRLHPDVFQDEADYRRANRAIRYLERVEAEAADVVKDVTKAHVQVIVESLDKRQPDWELEPEAALWSHLLPQIAEHFPQLVLSEGKAKLKHGVEKARARTRGISPGAVPAPPSGGTSTIGALVRGVVLGAAVLGAIWVGHHFWQQSHGDHAAPAPSAPATPTPEKTGTPSGGGTASSTPATNPNFNLPPVKEPPASPPENPPSNTPPPSTPPEPPAKPPGTDEPAPAPAPPMPAPPAMPPEKPPEPAPPEPAPANPPPATPPPAAPRTSVKLTQGIGVMLANGQVSLPAGTTLRYLGTEGANIRVSWNNNVFFVPAVATDMNTPAAPGSNPPAAPPMSKSAEDL